MIAMGPFGYPLDYLVLWIVYGSLLVHTWCYFRLSDRAQRRRRGRVLFGNLLVFLGLGGGVALGAESYLRFLSSELDPFGVSIPSRRWFAKYARLNSRGCRDREWLAEKPPGVRRIAFVGDSFLFGWGIERTEDRFSDRVAARARQAGGSPTEVLNVAKPGWGTADHLQAVTEVIDGYGVDEVVLCYVFNDIEKLLATGPGFDPTVPPEPRFFSSDGSCLLDYFYRTIVVPRVRSVRGYHDWLADGYQDPQVWRQHQQQLGEIVVTCRDRSVKLRVALLPFMKVGGTKFDRAGLHARMTAFLRLNEIESVDLLPLIEGRDVDTLVVNRHDAHPNEDAHGLFAERIWSSFYAAESK